MNLQLYIREYAAGHLLYHALLRLKKVRDSHAAAPDISMGKSP